MTGAARTVGGLDDTGRHAPVPARSPLARHPGENAPDEVSEGSTIQPVSRKIANERRSWMPNLGRVGGTRTHDPRIMSLHSDMLTRTCGSCFVPPCPDSPGRRIRTVPPCSVPCQRYRSRGPPTIVAAVRGHVPRTWRAGGRDRVGWCYSVMPNVGGVACLVGLLGSSITAQEGTSAGAGRAEDFRSPAPCGPEVRGGLPLCLTLLNGGRGVGCGVVGAARVAPLRSQGCGRSRRARPRPAWMSFRHPQGVTIFATLSLRRRR